MANAAKMMQIPLCRSLIAGYPGAGKTSCLAALANAGYKLRVINFDGNPESLIHYTRPEMRHNIDILSFEDPLTWQGSYIGVKGLPTAFPNAFRAMDQWKYEDPDGTPDDKGKTWTDLGKSSDWREDTVVVLDGTTGLGAAAMAHARACLNKTPLNTTRSVWGLASANQENFLARLTSMDNKFHVVVIAHLKIIGPEGFNDGDDELTKTLKEAKADLVPTRLFPSAVGRQLPQAIAGHFPVVIACEAQARGSRVERVLVATARADQDTKLPVANLETLGRLPIETGLLTIFEALGCKAPSQPGKAGSVAATG